MKNFFLFLLIISNNIFSQQEKLDSFFAARKEFSGVILIAEKGKPIYHKAFGYREFADQIPLQTSDIFELASVSKQFTAMIIMMLKEKNLLTHTSGLPDYQDIMDKYWDKTKVAGNPDCIEYLNKYAPPKHFEPGDKYEYSNTGYMLLASVAEKASG